MHPTNTVDDNTQNDQGSNGNQPFTQRHRKAVLLILLIREFPFEQGMERGTPTGQTSPSTAPRAPVDADWDTLSNDRQEYNAMPDHMAVLSLNTA
ncbi:hypothetical protein RE428_22550 [Marinobacter nanhaiticus D15-8W]|nr:hypothetical protein RE428_22550 [Marinobacter nanhaiticus D15-8W]